MQLRLLSLVLPSRRSLRLTAYTFCVFALLSVLAARLLHAQVGEAALTLGGELAGVAELTRDAEALVINGARFHHALVVVDETASAALDRVERECEKSPGALPEVVSELASRGRAALDGYRVTAAARKGVLRYERSGRGVLLCFARGSTSAPLALKEQLADFSRRSDLSVFGRVRYVFAEPSEGGRTRVMSLWSDEALDLRAMFPETGDSAGHDPNVLPRAPGFRRTFSAAAASMPFGIWLYVGREPQREALGFYQRWLVAHGFQRAAASSELGAESYLRADGFQVFVSANDEGGQTTVALVEAGPTEESPTASSEITE
jgi:hypothetical protein